MNGQIQLFKQVFARSWILKRQVSNFDAFLIFLILEFAIILPDVLHCVQTIFVLNFINFIQSQKTQARILCRNNKFHCLFYWRSHLSDNVRDGHHYPKAYLAVNNRHRTYIRHNDTAELHQQ